MPSATIHPVPIAVFGNNAQTSRLSEVGSFLSMLGASGIPLQIERGFSRYLRQHNILTPAYREVDFPDEDTAIVLTLGGDGTLLQGAAWKRNPDIPLLGINTGHLGFLTAYTLSESHLLLPDLKAGRLVAEPRLLLRLQCEADRLPEGFYPYALNEVALLKADTSSMINVSVQVKGHYLTDYRADGLIISTPTGSTGYNLSAGGPILDPTLDCVALTPISPHTLSVRPAVVGAGDKIMLKAESRAGIFRVSLDGRSFTLPSGMELTVEAAAKPLMLVRRESIDFASTLRSKLHWG